MPNSADFTVEDLPSGQLLRLSGDFVIASIGALDRSLRDINGPVSEIDISAVTHMDTVGAWLVHRTAKEHDAPITGGANDASRLIDAVRGADQAEAVAKPPISSLYHFLAEVGGAVVVGMMTFFQFLGFVGQVVKAFFSLLMNPRRFRWHAVVQHCRSNELPHRHCHCAARRCSAPPIWCGGVYHQPHRAAHSA
jgi:phospholipid/cholesterol/gamma-HCH transport system permease protein